MFTFIVNKYYLFAHLKKCMYIYIYSRRRIAKKKKKSTL